MLPRFSIITSVYNDADCLPRCIRSVANQGYPNKEHVLQDDGSTDRTPEVLQAHAHLIASWASSPNRGIYGAWNTALPRATGDWLLFLGADDYYSSPDLLSQAATALARCPDSINVAYIPVTFVDPLGSSRFRVASDWSRTRFRRRMTFAHAGVFHRRALFEKHGVFDASFRIAGDYEFLLRELRDNDAFFMGPIEGVHCTLGGLSTAPQTRVLTLRECARARSKHGLAPYGPHARFELSMALLVPKLTRLLGPSRTIAIRNCWRRLRGRPSIDLRLGY